MSYYIFQFDSFVVGYVKDLSISKINFIDFELIYCS